VPFLKKKKKKKKIAEPCKKRHVWCRSAMSGNTDYLEKYKTHVRTELFNIYKYPIIFLYVKVYDCILGKNLIGDYVFIYCKYA
jgi:hypothetical protein